MSLIEDGILWYMRKAKAPAVSVEEIAKHLDAKRDSVRAAMHRLRARGHVIQVAPKSAEFILVDDLSFITGCSPGLIAELRKGRPRSANSLCVRAQMSVKMVRWQLSGLELRGIVELRVDGKDPEWQWRGEQS
jgi:DNA-binding GntR family transcriptional regulator